MSVIVDPRRALRALLNVGPVPEAAATDRDIYNRAQSFIATYGPLRETREERLPIKTRELTEKVKGSALYRGFFGPPYTPQATVIHLAEMFSWAISLPQESQARSALNLTLGAIFNDPVTIDGTVHGTALDIDIVSGTAEPRPRDLLDAIALELLRSRKVISRCALCSKVFYRQFSKDKYCSPACASEARRQGQAEWARNRPGKSESRSKGKKKARKA